MAGKKQPKRLAYQLLTSEQHVSMYLMASNLVARHHQELRNAKIALAWCKSWKPDIDGHVRLGQCKKASDLDRELAPYDIVVLLSQEFWTNDRVTDAQREALLDHELMHACVKLDPDTHEPMVDEKGRTLYRLRKHDIEEFSEIVERHGCYKRDLEIFARALRRSAQEVLPFPTATMAQ
jgi:hypothetical protein